MRLKTVVSKRIAAMRFFFIRRAGDGESTSAAFQIRAIGRKEGEIGELVRPEFEALGLLKIERSSAGTRDLSGLQAYFVGGHRFPAVFSFQCVRDALAHVLAMRALLDSPNRLTRTGDPLFRTSEWESSANRRAFPSSAHITQMVRQGLALAQNENYAVTMPIERFTGPRSPQL